MKGLTLYQMIIVYGCPSHPNSNAVTTSNCKVDYVVKKQYTYKQSSDCTVNYSGVNNLSTTTGQHTMDIGAGLDHS